MLCGFVVSRLQCLQLSLRTRFPFHDSQVLCWSYKSPQERPKRRPRGPKSAKRPPRDAKDSAERRQESAKRRQDAPKSDLGAILARFWTPRGRPNLDFRCNCRRKSRFSCFSKDVGKRDPNRSQRRPLGDENGSQERPGRARHGPRGAKRAPGAAKSDPGAPREPPQRPKKGATKVTTSVCALRGGPGAPWEPPWSDFGAIWEPPGEHFQAIFVPFCSA